MLGRCLDVLRLVEWGSRGNTPPSLYHDDGPAYACPACQGIKPGIPAARHFIASAIGHKPDCVLANLLAKAEVA